LFSDDYEKCFTQGDNKDLVATDTQKNTVYVVAKRGQFNSPEGFGALICQHLLKEYPVLKGCQVQVNQVVWDRAVVDGQPHKHGFLLTSPETFSAQVSLDREGEGGDDHKSPPMTISSQINKMTVLKTTQSGFEGYLQDQYTILPPTKERCLATELDASWTYTPTTPTTTPGNGNDSEVDYAAVRDQVRVLLQAGIFGPADTGIYSPSLQATIYDAACLVLQKIPHVQSITLYTPNIHYIPCKLLLDQVGETFEDDVFIPTSEPSGIITCTVVRGDEGTPKTVAPSDTGALKVMGQQQVV
jgi:urate oxidase